AHRSRRLTSEAARDADLVVAMAREHIREVVAACPAAWPRAFTLKELVRRGERAGARPAGMTVGEWLAGLHAGRRPDQLMRASPDDDVADPIGRPRPDYERTAAELDDLTARLARLLAPEATEAAL
ncbi:MAG: low molecular weight phosphatase family protein, partial [Acidimicrobiia bacterium]